jgi:hypothetical protein
VGIAGSAGVARAYADQHSVTLTRRSGPAVLAAAFLGMPLAPSPARPATTTAVVPFPNRLGCSPSLLNES